MSETEKDAEKRPPDAERDEGDHEGEDGYGSVDEEEKKSVDTKEVISNPG